MKVLLAEDNHSHRELMQILIRRDAAHATVLTVDTGGDFLAQLRNSEFDVALLDYHLPDANADELLPEIDKIPNRPPVVVISSDRASETIISALRSGGRDFLPKEEAFQAGNLVARILAVMSRQEGERRLIEQQKDACLATMAGGLAHSFNNMLVGIQGKAALLKEPTLERGRHDDYCDSILRTAERLADLARQLLAYARGGNYDLRPVDPHKAIRDALGMLAGTIPPGLSIRTLLADDIWAVQADYAQLVQVLLNLVLNGCEATAGRGNLTIFTENIEFAEPWTDDWLGVHAAGPYIRIVVADNGGGIPSEIRRRIFEPYVSTKGDSRGLGLATVRGIVSVHGGGVLVEERAEEGASFHVLLPRGGAPPTREPRLPIQVAAAPARVLVVEDEPEVREVIGEILSLQGHDITFAEDGRQARRRLAESVRPFEVVLLDMRLPDCSGAEVLDVVRSESPGSSVILTSGYERVSVLQDVLAGSDDIPFLAKPFLPNDLLALVADALHRRQESPAAEKGSV